MNRAIGELTFNINQIKIEEAISLAERKLKTIKGKLNTAQGEITYLKSELGALTALIDFYNSKEAREKFFCKLFVHDEDHEYANIFDSSEFKLAWERRTFVCQRIDYFEGCRVNYQQEIDFIEKDIVLLSTILKAPFRSKISDLLLA